MADILAEAQASPATPAAGSSVLYPISAAIANLKRWATTDENGKDLTVPPITNASAAAQAYTTAEIYLTGSRLDIPVHGLQVGTVLRWRVVLTKTAGTGALVWIVRIGTLGTTGDAAICTLTQVSAPTSATDTAFVDVEMVIRTIGAAATSQCGLNLAHVLDVTGFSQLRSNVQQVAGSTFNSTTPALIAGLTFNHQTAGAGNIEIVTAEMTGV